MSRLVPYVLDKEKQQIFHELNGRDVAAIFDGTCGFGEALAIILRDVEDFYLHQ